MTCTNCNVALKTCHICISIIHSSCDECDGSGEYDLCYLCDKAVCHKHFNIPTNDGSATVVCETCIEEIDQCEYTSIDLLTMKNYALYRTSKLQEEIVRLTEENSKLMIYYQPGGPGFEIAKKQFELTLETQI